MDRVNDAILKLKTIQERLDMDAELDMDILSLAEKWSKDIQSVLQLLERLSVKDDNEERMQKADMGTVMIDLHTKDFNRLLESDRVIFCDEGSRFCMVMYTKEQMDNKGV